MNEHDFALEPFASDDRRRVLVLSSSPRLDGNSEQLAEAVVQGAEGVGAQVRKVRIHDHVHAFLRDCRQCRRSNGECSLDDRHGWIFRELYLQAEAVVYATPVWWYGMSAQLKAFLDRTFCYLSDSYPGAGKAVEAMRDKRIALVLSAEESNFPARQAVVGQVAEMCRYLHQHFVGIVVGIGNSRTDIVNDPSNPIESARLLGSELLCRNVTDYRISTERPKKVWSEDANVLPAKWR